MKSTELYANMENDFKLAKCNDDWSNMSFNDYTTQNFKSRYMGLLCDNSKEIKKVYTAVFLNDSIVNKSLEKDEKNILIFTHHPMHWDITKLPCFVNLSTDSYSNLAKKQISVYTLHTPLDNNGPYSTSTCYARNIGITPDDEFYEYFGHKVGIIGKSSVKTVSELADIIEKSVGHKIAVNRYGNNEIKGGKVAVIAGGGNEPEALTYLADAGINTFVTGICKLNTYYQPSVIAHEFAKEERINVIGTSHYSSEVFACKEMIKYFGKLGIPAEFIDDIPCFEDM